MSEAVPLKRCSRGDDCVHPDGPWLPATPEFFRMSGDYLSRKCRKCATDKRKTPEYREQQREYMRRKRATPEGKAYQDEYNRRPKAIEARKRWQQSEQGKQWSRDRARETRKTEAYQIYIKAYRKRPEYRIRLKQSVIRYNQTRHGKEMSRLNSQRRRKRLRNAPVNDFSPADFARMMHYWENRCAVCGRIEDFWTVIAIDHWIPISRNGQHTSTNIVPLCNGRKGVPAGEPTCNLSKKDKLPDEWLSERFGKRKARRILKRVEAYFDWINQQKQPEH